MPASLVLRPGVKTPPGAGYGRATAAGRSWPKAALVCACNSLRKTKSATKWAMAILVGTASWTDKTLIESGKFYPPEARSPEARLRFYAKQFPFVEVDASYYAIPTPGTAQAWAERTPPDFTFNVKAFRLFTGHQTDPRFLEKDIREALPPTEKRMLYYRDVPTEILDELWRRFKLALVPLARNAKLAAVHFQFAPWVINDRDGIAHVIECVDRMADHHLSVEFRNQIWFDEAHRVKTLEFQKGRREQHDR